MQARPLLTPEALQSQLHASLPSLTAGHNPWPTRDIRAAPAACKRVPLLPSSRFRKGRRVVNRAMRPLTPTGWLARALSIQTLLSGPVVPQSRSLRVHIPTKAHHGPSNQCTDTGNLSPPTATTSPSTLTPSTPQATHPRKMSPRTRRTPPAPTRLSSWVTHRIPTRHPTPRMVHLRRSRIRRTRYRLTACHRIHRRCRSLEGSRCRRTARIRHIPMGRRQCRRTCHTRPSRARFSSRIRHARKMDRRRVKRQILSHQTPRQSRLHQRSRPLLAATEILRRRR